MRRCEQELCRNWTGDGCVCSVLDIEPDANPCPDCSKPFSNHDEGCINE